MVLIWGDADIHPVSLVRPLLVVSVAAIAIVFAFCGLMRDRDRGGLAATAVIAGLVSDHPLATLGLLLVTMLVLLEGAANRGRAWRRGPNVARGLTVFGATMIALALATTTLRGAFGGAMADLQRDLSRSSPTSSYDPRMPDILIVLVDSFPGDEAVEIARHLDVRYDPDAFRQELEQRGFDVLRNSRTNYLFTRYVLASMFTGAHLGETLGLESTGSTTRDQQLLRWLADDGSVLRALADAGYERIRISPGSNGLAPRAVDRIVELPNLSELEVVLIKSSGVGNLLGLLNPDILSNDRRDRIRRTFDLIVEVANERRGRARFLFAHVMSPHAPAVFGPAGEDVNGSRGMNPSEGDYELRFDEQTTIEEFGQAQDVATRLIRAIDAIDLTTEPAPIIVVMSDHGNGLGLNETISPGSDYRSRISNFLAVRAPSYPNLLPPGTTPVNVLPRILNAVLRTDLPIRSDTTWVWDGPAEGFNFVQLDPVTMLPDQT